MNHEKYDLLLQEKIKKVNALNKQKKEIILDSFGLYTKVTSDVKNDDFPFSETFNEQIIYYKKVYEDISDEELEELIKIDQEIKGDSFDQSELTYHRNNIKFSNGLGILTIILGFIVFVILMSNEVPVYYGIISLISSFIMASILFSLSHIAAQLNHIIKITTTRDKK